MEFGVKDTAAYRIIRQITDHTWGSDVDYSDEDVVSLCRGFSRRGGSWESLMSGDMGSIVHLEAAIDDMVGAKKLEEAHSGGR
jgi:hypothetical protein